MMRLSSFPMQLIHREILLSGRQLKLIVQACLFFLMILFFFPLTMPAIPQLLRQVLPGLLWIAALFAMLLTSERLFQQEYEDGIIEQWLVSGMPVSVFVFSKLAVHWLMNMLPMLLCCPMVALLFALSPYELTILCVSLVCGTPALLSLCAFAAVLSTSLQQKGILMALLVLPLTIPIMIFGADAMTSAMHHLPVSGQLAFLLSLSLITTALMPLAIAAMIRISLVD